MKKLLLGLILLLAIGAGANAGINASKAFHKEEVKQVLSSQSNQTVDDQAVARPGLPQTVQIPKIGVKAAIESVGMDSEGRMDVPKKAANTAWYNLGFRPGQKGNAVLAGHYDKADGSPAVFWDIAKLVKGDKIIVSDDKGKDRTFKVTRIAKYPYDKFPLEEVFGASSESMLNLITCHGKWNEKTKNYTERMVVYSQQVD